MPYIDKDLAIKTAIESCVKVVGHGITQIDAVDIADAFEDIPTADVVPKSEVEKLVQENETLKDNNEHLAVILEETKVELKAMRGAANSLKMHYEKAKSEVASEIFVEIEKVTSKDFTKKSQDFEFGYKIAIQEIIAELKKKYTEGVPAPAPEEKYFSPQQVRDMSPQELHYNFEAIRKSMELWQI